MVDVNQVNEQLKKNQKDSFFYGANTSNDDLKDAIKQHEPRKSTSQVHFGTNATNSQKSSFKSSKEPESALRSKSGGKTGTPSKSALKSIKFSPANVEPKD